MTRINVLPVESMTQPELSGEWKEIWRVFGYVKARVTKGQTPKDVRGPKEYTMGEGHVLFFYTRLGFVRKRIHQLYTEMLRRGYSPNKQMMDDAIESSDLDIPVSWYGDYQPTPEAIEINIRRMIENGTRSE